MSDRPKLEDLTDEEFEVFADDHLKLTLIKKLNIPVSSSVILNHIYLAVLNSFTEGEILAEKAIRS